MATNVTWDGTTYSIPAGGEINWPNLMNFLIALGTKAATSITSKNAIRLALVTPDAVSATADYNVVTKLTVPGAVAVNLPAGIAGQTFVILDGTGDARTNNVTITPFAGDTIGGAATLVLDHDGQAAVIQYVGTDWKVLVKTLPSGTVQTADLRAGSVTGTGNIVLATSPALVTPTGIVKGDVGLGNVDNTSDATKNAATVTLTNKTLTSPVINSPTGLVKADVGLGNVDNTSDATKDAAATTLTNKTITSPLGLVKGDVGLGNVDNTSDATKDAATATLTNKTLTSPVIATIVNGGNNLTLPTTTDTLVGRATTDALTNKDVDGGTATNASRLTLPKAATATLAALTRKQGTLLYDTTLGGVFFDDGAALQPLASSGVATSTVAGTVTSFVPVILSAVNVVSSADYTVLTGDGYSTISVSTGASDRVINLPAAASNAGRKITIKKTDAGAGFVIIDASGAETIDGALTNQLHQQGSYVTLYCDGTSWYCESVSDYLTLGFSNVTLTTTVTAIVGIGLPGGRWVASGSVATVGGLGVVKAIDFNLTTPANSSGTIGVDRFLAAVPSFYAGFTIEIQPIRITSLTSYYLNLASDVSTLPSTYGFIMAKRIG